MPDIPFEEDTPIITEVASLPDQTNASCETVGSPRIVSSNPTNSPSELPECITSQAPRDIPLAFQFNPELRVFNDEVIEQMLCDYAIESKEWIVGPMPVDRFLSAFLPECTLHHKDIEALDISDFADAFNSVPVKGRTVDQLFVCNY